MARLAAGMGLLGAAALGVTAAALMRGGARAAVPEYDLVITNGRVVDGTGAPAFPGDVAIKGDRIAAVGRIGEAAGARRLDAHGLMVAPGFIDLLGQSEMELLADGRAESKVRQGVTTEITGEGGSVAPVVAEQVREAQPWLDKHHVTIDWIDFDGYFRRLEAARPAINLGTFVGAAQVRRAVLGADNVAPTEEQLARMEAEVDKGMRQGAFGLSTALIYAPGLFARTGELVALARVASRHGGIYATHLRDEGARILPALEEAFTIGREARIPLEIWHLKVAGRGNFGRMPQVLEAIESARAHGLQVGANVYPYTASANSLASSLPAWAREGGVDAMIARLRDPAQRQRILRQLRARRLSAHDIMVSSVLSPELARWRGQRLDAVARAMGVPVEEAMLALVEKDRGSVAVVRFVMDERDLQAALRKSWVAFGADSAALTVEGADPNESRHPRAFGTMARVLGHYARELGLFTMEEAVRRMTSLPAGRVGLRDRGLLRPGMMADVVAFDPARIRDRATYEQPNLYAEGVEHVIVNGRVVLESGRMTGERGGRPLRHTPALGGLGGEAPTRPLPGQAAQRR